MFHKYRNPHHTIIKNQQRFFRRQTLWKPFMAERNLIRNQKLLDKYERACANGEVFVPDGRLPPWKRRINPELDRAKGEKVNFLGFRVRLAAPPHSTPGFPTHWQ
jgi:hypothetical protein